MDPLLSFVLFISISPHLGAHVLVVRRVEQGEAVIGRGRAPHGFLGARVAVETAAAAA